MAEAPESPFWGYSLAVYGRPGVAEACLALQGRHGLDVNLLLFCCWAGQCGRALTPEDLDRLTAAAGPWHEGVVKPLRAVRRWLKSRQDAGAQPLRARIKESELEAERIEQQLLAEILVFAAGETSPALAAANLMAYLTALDLVPGKRDRVDLAALLCGLFDELPPEDAAALLGRTRDG